jgi:DnaJ-class molecular chaperone
LRILGLREGATEGEVKAAYRAMSRIYHPDKHNSGFTGMSDEEAVEFFQHLNNAHSYLREIMYPNERTIRKNDTEERKKYERTNYDLELQEGEIY